MLRRFFVVAACLAFAACSDEGSGTDGKTIVIKFPHVTAPATPKGQGQTYSRSLSMSVLGAVSVSMSFRQVSS